MNIYLIRTLVLICALSLITSSCAVGPDYKKPEINLPDKFHSADLLSEDKSNLQSEGSTIDNWWDTFNDPILSSLIAKASSSNLTILQAIERVEQGRAATRQTFFGLFPTPSVTSQFLKSKIAGVRFPGIASNGIEFEVYTAGLEVNWEIDLFGRIRRAIEANESLAIGSAFSLDDSIRLVQAQIATAYIQLRGAQLQRDITKENSNRQKSILSLLQKRFEIGDYSPFDFERAKALTSRTEALLSQYDSIIAMNIHRIAALTGEFSHDLMSELEVRAPLPEFKGPNRISSPEELIRRRPDVKVAEQNLHAATAEIGVAMADLFPKVSIFGSINEEGRSPGDWFSSNSRAFSFGPQMSWSILNLGAIINNIKFKKSSTRENLLKYKEVIILTLEEVENVITELSVEIERNFHLQNAFNASQNAERIAELRYKEGRINYLDLLSSQQELLETESELADSKTRKLLAYVSLYRALGGTWEENDTSRQIS
jgi:outer membrane protein, multidrug efflux system